MMQNYNSTLNLPKTDFPMRGNLPAREQSFFKTLDNNHLYQQLMEKTKNNPLYVLHDGPPYANGEIHLGTALNKILKDFIVKQKNMTGYCAPYVPGWDTHGLPIELKALKAAGTDKNQISNVKLRQMCKEFALKHVKHQKEQFKKLGLLGDYDHPYLTLNPEFEAKQIEVFGTMAEKDFIYKGLKPVYWCPTCNTALAEAEIEYHEDICYSVYVKFNVSEDFGFFNKLGIDKSKVFFVIWTTTTWTLPGNTAICLGPRYDYTLVKHNDEYYVIAQELVESSMKAAGIENYQTIGSFKGIELENMKAAHPFLERDSQIIVGDHVTLETGTGCVHTAPGHGVEDFEVCKNHYPDIPIIVPVDSNGTLTQEAGEFAGLSTHSANKAITKKLEETSHLFAIQKINHQYPHCWRCKSPILFRATEQWFCSIDHFKDQAMEAVKGVRWIPAWGESRIENMIQSRTDWCISRQRVWGVPIPILYCKSCGKPIVNSQSISAIADMFRKEGADSWYVREPSEFLPDDFACPECGSNVFVKETDIMDVWFDSGCSHAAVLENNDQLSWPADLYLEGADQYRGWFQSSLLTAVATKGTAPYKAVCTHGWVVDGEGKKMSKSLANGVAPEKIVEQYGADILRLWVASSDYHADIRISPVILKQLTETYRKIRNTARFILGNIHDFNPDTDSVPLNELMEIDQWALSKLNRLIETVNTAYNNFEFYNIYHAIQNFCVVEMSNFYLDVIKDRLYCEAPGGKKRRSAQTAMCIIINAFTRLIAPILAFTSEEIWAAIPHSKEDNAVSVLLNQMPSKVDLAFDDAFEAKWENIHILRNAVKKVLEDKRAAKQIGASLEVRVVIYGNNDLATFAAKNEDILTDAFIVSNVAVQLEGAGEYKFEKLGISIDALPAEGQKCERCWTYKNSVGCNHEHPTLCDRCAKILSSL